MLLRRDKLLIHFVLWLAHATPIWSITDHLIASQLLRGYRPPFDELDGAVEQHSDPDSDSDISQSDSQDITGSTEHPSGFDRLRLLIDSSQADSGTSHSHYV